MRRRIRRPPVARRLWNESREIPEGMSKGSQDVDVDVIIGHEVVFIGMGGGGEGGGEEGEGL